ncbi:unnamed protein product, partial [Allacma fusca]
RLAKYSRS